MRIASELARMDAEYAQIVPLLDGVDGASAAALMETIEANRRKSRMAAQTLAKLIAALESSAMQMEALDRLNESIFVPGSGAGAGALSGGAAGGLGKGVH
ncbi:MAG: hypothetical protein LBR44_00805 [Clostridiales Family XIII bacterium]|nr:hypothetical protein [Clostridiales Family XIII bacterium]